MTMVPESMSEAIRLVLLLVILAVAVFTDVRWRRIPNALTGPAILAGAMLNIVGSGLDGLLQAVAGFVVGAAILLGPVALRWWGAGDLKLLAAIGAIGGPGFVLWSGLYALAAGGVMAVAVLLVKRQAAPVLAGVAIDLYTRQTPRPDSGITLPYAVPIAAGTLIAMAVG